MSEHIPSSKTIPFPPWTSGVKHLFSVGDIVSVFAMWAVRQSPYPWPYQLEEACQALAAKLHPEWEGAELGFRSLGCMQIEEILDTACKGIPEVLAWNEPKSGHDAPFVSSSRFHKPAQDDDFIDLGALFRNTAHSLFAERTLEANDPKPAEDHGAPQVGEEPHAQVERLAGFIMAEVPGEPSRSEGAVDTAIRWMRTRLSRDLKVDPELAGIIEVFLSVIMEEIGDAEIGNDRYIIDTALGWLKTRRERNLGEYRKDGTYPEGLLWDYPWLDAQGEIYAGPYRSVDPLGPVVVRVNPLLSQDNRERISRLFASSREMAAILRNVLQFAPGQDRADTGSFARCITQAANALKAVDGTD